MATSAFPIAKPSASIPRGWHPGDRASMALMLGLMAILAVAALARPLKPDRQRLTVDAMLLSAFVASLLTTPLRRQ